ncbi:MAG: ATP-binding protein, partial [Nocardiopsaceae bacterium]|nr:ATP-binding protein [Nocardiopsaceae bacterium]
MFVAGRRREMEQVGRLLDRATNGAGGLIVFFGPPGSGKTAMAEAAIDEARGRGLDVLRASPRASVQGRLAWAQMLRDTGAPDGLVASLLGDEAGPLDRDSAARHLVSGPARLIVVDDVDRGGEDAVEMLSFVAARSAAAGAAVIATAAAPLGLGTELPLAGLSEADLAAVL